MRRHDRSDELRRFRADRFLDSWRNQAAYPLVRIHAWNSTHSRVTQTICDPLGLGVSSVGDDNDDSRQKRRRSRWTIPLLLRSFNGNNNNEDTSEQQQAGDSLLILDANETIAAEPIFIDANAFVRGGGYFRVLYEADAFDRLLDRANALDELTRAVTLENLRFLAFNNLVPPRLLLRALHRLFSARLPTSLRVFFQTGSMLHFYLESAELVDEAKQLDVWLQSHFCAHEPRSANLQIFLQNAAAQSYKTSISDLMQPLPPSTCVQQLAV